MMCVVALLTATRLIDNICEWLKKIPVIGAVIGWFV